MKRSCKYCGRYHDTTFTCPAKPIRTKNGSEAEKFRSRHAWKKKSIEIRTRDKGLCQNCFPSGKYSFDVEVHHIVKLEQDIRKGLDNFNLITLCKSCHVMADSGQIEVKVLQEMAKKQERPLPQW